MTRPLLHTPTGARARRPLARMLAVVLALAGIAPLSGCLFGALAENYRRTGSHTVDPEYEGLADRTFAVVVASNRVIDAEFPTLAEEIAGRVSARLAENAGAAGVVPTIQVAKYCLNNPTWRGKPYSELAKALGGVQRLVVIDLREFRLNEPGNRYEWKGLAAANVAVVETDSPLPDSFAFEKLVRVDFPGRKEPPLSADQVGSNAIASVLLQRLVDRASWLLYRHEEPNEMSY